MKFKTNILLRLENRRLKSEIETLKYERERVFKFGEDKIIRTENEYQELLEKETEIIENKWRNKNKKLINKLDIIKNEYKIKNIKLDQDIEAVENQKNKIVELLNAIKPHIDRIAMYKENEYQSTLNIKRLTSEYLKQYLIFDENLIEKRNESDE